MTAVQNLDVYETFQVQQVTSKIIFLINALPVFTHGLLALNKVGQSNEYASYPIDLCGESPLACRRPPSISRVIFSGVLDGTCSTRLAGLQ